MTNLIHSLASSLKWLVRLLGKGSEIRGHGNVVRLLVGSLTAERSFNARRPLYLRTRGRGCRPPGSIPHVYALSVGLPGGPNTSLLSITRQVRKANRGLGNFSLFLPVICYQMSLNIFKCQSIHITVIKLSHFCHMT